MIENAKRKCRIETCLSSHPDSYAFTNGVIETLFTVNQDSSIRDIGAAIGNVDNAADNKDMVIGYIAGQGLIKFKVYFDLSLSSGNLNWGGTSTEQTISPPTTQYTGLDMVMLNIDGDAREEMVIFSTLISGTRYLHWWVVNFNNDGSIASTTAFSSNTITIEDKEIGAGVVDVTNRKIAVSMNAESITTDEYVSNPEYFFIFTDSDTEEFYIDRDSLWASHGTSDNRLDD